MLSEAYEIETLEQMDTVVSEYKDNLMNAIELYKAHATTPDTVVVLDDLAKRIQSGPFNKLVIYYAK